MKRLKFLEWLWIVHASLGLVALLCLAATNSVIFLVAVECLGFPLGWLLKSSDLYSLLPAAAQYLLSYLVIVLNGGLFYLLLRTCFRRKRAAETARSQ